MIPTTYPSFLNPFSDQAECKVSYLSSVSGLTAWTDYIPVQTVVYSGNVEGRTEANGYQAVHPVGATGNVAWTDYVPVYEDATKTVAWSTDANGYIPIGLSEDGVLAFLETAEFGVELTHTAVPQRAAPGTTATFTRATTKTVENNDGYLVTLLAGEIGFSGARRVRNLLTYTEDFSNPAWNKYESTISANATTAPNGTLTADKLIASVANDQHAVRQSVSIVSGAVHSEFFHLKQGEYSWARVQAGWSAGGLSAYFNLATGEVGTVDVGATATISDEGDGWYKCTITATSNAASGFNQVDIAEADGDIAFAGNGTDGIYIWGAQLEDVTAQTTQTAGEYVSVGVPSDWAGDELVTNGTFDTDTTGWTDAGATLSVASNALKVLNPGATNGGAYQSLTTVVGVKYALSLEKKAGGTVANQIVRVGTSPGGQQLLADSTLATGTNNYEFTATTTTSVVFVYNSAELDAFGLYDNISVKQAYYHGSFVDGVKCFATDLAGNALTTMRRYNAEGARTNLVVRSNELDDPSWGKNNATVSANTAVASDGTTSLDKIVEDATTSTHTVYQTFAGTSGSYTISVEMKQAERTWGFITEGNSVTATAYFDLANGVVGTVAGTGSPSATITALANGAYRCTMTFTAGANANCQFGPAAGDGAAAYAGDITKGIYAGMVGFENAPFASSYIATTTAAVTRDAEIDAYSTASNITAAAGYISLQFTPTHTPSGTIALWGTYVDASNYTAILHDATNLIFRKRIAGVNYDATIANAFVSGTTYTVAATWGASGTSIALDGTLGTGHANTTAAQIAATMQFGADGNSLQQPFASVGAGYIGQRQLSASEMEAITQ